MGNNRCCCSSLPCNLCSFLTSPVSSFRNQVSQQRNSSEQDQLANDLLEQGEQDASTTGGPLMEMAVGFAAKILPCSEAVLSRLIWVLLWSWKAAPVALYESLELDKIKQSMMTTNNKSQKNDKDEDEATTAGCSCGAEYFQKWWQKFVAIPVAMGFYYFLYDYVAQPLLNEAGCCGSDSVTQVVAISLLVLHFLSGLSIHLYQKQKAEQDCQETANNNNNNKNDVELSQQSSNNSDYAKAVANASAPPEPTGDWIMLQDGNNNNNNGATNTTSPPTTATATTSAAPVADNNTSTTPKKRKFWPFGKKKKAQNLVDSKQPQAAIV
ncbi:expressed unknown protein [Seminavis robusta]|uniref:Uncharacterized protein n=1 Tax=Seminavis robusta TaxID=568900 RepID=A0A9N8ENH7_9STRA|nr:expressed unknown protein [Seminavis robusta]|eukprot:Sro1431_g272060.1 n/a (325) ;mRNA; f:26820-27794